MTSKSNLRHNMEDHTKWFPAVFREVPGDSTTVKHTFEHKLLLAPSESKINFDEMAAMTESIFAQYDQEASYRYFFYNRVEDGIENTYLVVATEDSNILNAITAISRNKDDKFFPFDKDQEDELFWQIKDNGSNYLVRGDYIIRATKGSIRDNALFSEYLNPEIADEEIFKNATNFTYHPEAWVRNNIPYQGKE